MIPLEGMCAYAKEFYFSTFLPLKDVYNVTV